jgi:hypothetical protein
MINKQQEFSLFDWLKQIVYEKHSWSSFNEEQKKTFSSYMIHKYISMHEPYIEVANLGQQIPHSDKEKIYKFYCNMLPKKNVFFGYVKGNKKSINEDLIKQIAHHFSVGFGEAEEYISLLGKFNVMDILKKRGLEDKEIKKLTKDIK